MAQRLALTQSVPKQVADLRHTFGLLVSRPSTEAPEIARQSRTGSANRSVRCKGIARRMKNQHATFTAITQAN